jgi:V/A-type H+-transporting ATPase subunit C
MLRAFRPKDQIYTSVRAHALRGTLLSYSILSDMASSKNLDDLVTRLKASPYNPQVSKVSKPYNSKKLELAFREHLVYVHFNLAKTAKNSNILDAYFWKYIVGNLKTIIKGKALGRSYEEIAPNIDLAAEELVGRRDLIVKALAAESVEHALELLATSEFGDELQMANEVYKDKQNVQVFDLFIDNGFLKRVLDSINKYKIRYVGYIGEVKQILDLVSIDIDSYNILAILRGKLWELSTSEIRNLILTTFKVTKEQIENMVESPNLQECLKVVSKTRYSKLVPSGLAGEHAIAKLEENFQIQGYQIAKKSFLQRVFGIGVILSLIRLKELEVKNLSAIAFGIEQGLSGEAILSKLILPKT